jgi:hypothetical protein
MAHATEGLLRKALDAPRKANKTHLSRRPYLAFARAQEGSAGIVRSAVCAAEQDVGEPDDIRSPHQSGARAGQRKGLQRTEHLDQLIGEPSLKLPSYSRG